MKTKVWILAVCAGLLLAVMPAGAQTADMKALLSKLEAMGHGYHSDAEWAEVFTQIDGMVEKAETAGDWSKAVDAEVIRASVFSDMLGEPKRALSILRETRKNTASTACPAFGRPMCARPRCWRSWATTRASRN